MLGIPSGSYASGLIRYRSHSVQRRHSPCPRHRVRDIRIIRMRCIGPGLKETKKAAPVESSSAISERHLLIIVSVCQRPLLGQLSEFLEASPSTIEKFLFAYRSFFTARGTDPLLTALFSSRTSILQHNNRTASAMRSRAPGDETVFHSCKNNWSYNPPLQPTIVRTI